jgi:hypothetical protein
LLYIKKEQIKFTGVICASLILVIGSFFQLLPTNPFGNNYDILITIPLIYADDDCKDDKDDDCKDDKDDDCKDDKDEDSKDDKDEDSGNIDSENEQDTDNESVENDNEDTTKNLNTDNDNNRISTPAEDSSTSPPSSTTTLQNDNNDNEILTSTITNEKQSTPYINLTQLDNTKTEGEHVMANKTAKNTNENSLANVIKSKQQQLQQLQLQLQLQQQQQQQIQQQQQERNEQKTENIRIITTLINSPEQLTGKAKVTVTFNEDENKQVTFQSNNKTITAEEETVFPLTLVKTVNKEAEEQPSTMNVCAVIEGFENTCDTVLLQENQTKPYRVTLELINFEELEPVS